IPLSQAMLDALRMARHIPPDVQKRIDAVQPETGSPHAYNLELTEDEGMELSELLQWHVRTDAATGKPTVDTAPYADVIVRIAEAQL
ncbi:MAG TPA: hypothetical protein VMT21_04765, partial [Gemmatimonadales bacterium]|nr:hypothetical protein [Gemmatimonadales bacterium]